MSNEALKRRVQFGSPPWQKTSNKLMMVAPGFVPQGQYVSNKPTLWELSYSYTAPPEMSQPHEKTPEHPREISGQVHASHIIPIETATTITTESLTEVLSQEPEQHQSQLELPSEPEAPEAPESSVSELSEPLHQEVQSHEPLSTPPIALISPEPDFLPIPFTPPDQPDKPLDNPLPDPLEATLAALSIPITPLTPPPVTPTPPSLVPPDPDMQLMEPWSKELLEQYAALPLPPFYDTLVQQEKVASEIRKQNVCLQNVHSQAQQYAGATALTLSGIGDQLSALDTDISGIKDSIQDVYNFLQDKWDKRTDEEKVNKEEEDDDDDEEEEDQEDYQDEQDEEGEGINPSAYSFAPRFAPSLSPSPSPTPSTPPTHASTPHDARLIQLLESVERRLAAGVSPEECLMSAMDAVFQLIQATQKMADDIMALVPFTTGFLKCSKPNWRIQLEKILQSHLEGLGIVRDKLLESLEQTGVTLIAPEDEEPFSPELHKAIDRVPNHEHAGRIAQLIRYGYLRNNAPLRYATVAVYY